MASQPGIAALCQEIAAAGGRASPSSLKADLITPALAQALGGSGNRSVTVAPEAGSERMRRVINKNLTEAEILRAAEWLVGGGVEALKLYVMIGLPTETDDGRRWPSSTCAAAVRARLLADGRPRVGRIPVSINPFVPKPWTPFQWEPMEDLGVAQARSSRSVRRALARASPAVQVETESPREAYLQTLLSRGDRRVAPLLVSACTPTDGAGGRCCAALRAAGCDGCRRSRPLRAPSRTRPTSCCRGTSSTTASTSATCSPSGARRCVERQTPPCDIHDLPDLRRVLTGASRPSVIAGIGVDLVRDRSHRARARRAATARASATRVFTDAASRRTARRGGAGASRATRRASPPRKRR